ncbi:hypothetical protein E2C01_093089 [Portunus trituberculatus]|uniref:Uncharacterized protein n=1 Tax=Portunus trituberculatus TaxID=210409 RepID=A0A5B7JSE2_PORTR|nr:hypothetical protein [Portunus trituberculatus]
MVPTQLRDRDSRLTLRQASRLPLCLTGYPVLHSQSTSTLSDSSCLDCILTPATRYKPHCARYRLQVHPGRRQLLKPHHGHSLPSLQASVSFVFHK